MTISPGGELFPRLHQQDQPRAVGFQTAKLRLPGCRTVAGHANAQTHGFAGHIGEIEPSIRRQVKWTQEGQV